MKRILLLCSICLSLSMMAQTPKNVKYNFTEASDLTLCGKLFNNTPNPYHRVDTVKYKGFTRGENQQVRETSGISVAFKTNSTVISVKTDFAYRSMGTNSTGIALRGYDLYIKDKNGKWLWAGAQVASDSHPDENVVLVKDMDNSMKECLIYFPLFSEEKSIKIGTEQGSKIEAVPQPFRHRIAIFGSSFTHGASNSKAGMPYPAQLTRMTGLQFLSLGCSGNCKMQPYFADVLVDVDADAFVFDAFSNPDAKMIKDRLFPFIEKLVKAHPGKPLIFQRTIYRERRNFSKDWERFESAKWQMSDSLMAIACKKYPDVYYISPNASNETHETSVDGTHPGDYGYTLWAKSIEKPLLKIFKKYGIK